MPPVPYQGRIIAHTPHAITALDFSPDSCRLLGKDRQEALWWWDVDGAVPLKILLPEKPVTAACLLDARTAAIGTREGAIAFWDLEAGTCVRVLPAHPEASAIDGMMGGNNRQFSYHDRDNDLSYGSTRNDRGGFYGHAGPVTALAGLRQGRYLASAGLDRTLRLWDRRTGECRWLFGAAEGGFAVPVRGCWDYRGGLAAWGKDVTLWRVSGKAVRRWFWDAVSEQPVRRFTLPGAALAFARNGRIAAAADGTAVMVIDPVSLQEMDRWDCDAGRVLALAVSPDSRWLATAHEDCTVRIWPPTV